MPRQLEEFQLESRLLLKCDDGMVFEVGDVTQYDGLVGLGREIPDGILGIEPPLLAHIDRYLQRLLQFAYGTDVVEVAVRQEDGLDGQPLLADELEQLPRLCAGVNEKAVFRLVVGIDVGVGRDVFRDSCLQDHAYRPFLGLDGGHSGRP